MTRRRLVLVLVLGAAIAIAYTVWLALQVRSDLAHAQSSAERFQRAFDSADDAGREEALRDLQDAAAAAKAHTDGLWWAMVCHAPIVGDDATGVRALSSSLDLVATEGVAPLSQAVDLLDGLTGGGRIDVDVLDRMSQPVGEAQSAFDRAADDVVHLDSSGYAGAIRSRFEEYVDVVTRADRVLSSAETATEVMPGMVGADGPRDYLLVFQNNAEIRATGGMPGSWALVHADRGQLEIRSQGSAFRPSEEPILPLSDAELEIYDRQLGIYWQDAGFTPDFPRAAQLLAAHYEANVPERRLDGVIALDPVAMSYLIRGTGPVQVGDMTLTSANVVEALLSQPYLQLDPDEQNALFERAARAIFDAATGDLADPVAFVEGLGRSADEGRLLVASFVDRERKALEATQVAGALAGDDGSVPHVDIGLNDATGSKMSYYLRYFAEVRSTGCSGGRQQLSGSMSLSQSIPPEDAAMLPASVTGGGIYGTQPGSQLLLVRLYAPFGGELNQVRLDGKTVRVTPVDLDGRQVATVVVLLDDTDDITLHWIMEGGPGQTSAGELGITPGVRPGSGDRAFASAC